MVATRRKRAADGSSSEEEDDQRLDADFTGQDDGGDDHTHKIPLLDARTTAEYKLYQGRLYVNCTTFPSS